MSNLPESFYLIAVVLIFQGFLVLLVIYFFIDKFFSTRKERLEQNLVKEEAYKLAQKSLDDAQTTSFEIVKSAKQTASKLIGEAEFNLNTMKTEMTAVLMSLVEQHKKDIAGMFAVFKATISDGFEKERISSLTEFDGVFASVKTEALSQLKSFQDVITKNTLNIDAAMQEQSSKYLAELKEKMSAYEKEQKEKLRETSLKVLSDLCSTYFKDNLTINEHEEVVLKLVEDAYIKTLVGGE